LNFCFKLRYDNLDYSADQFIRNNLSLIPAECTSAALADLRISEDNSYSNTTARECDNSSSLEASDERCQNQSAADVDAVDTFNLLKRLIVKKKYALYTIKQENLLKKNRLKRMSTTGANSWQQAVNSTLQSTLQSNQQQVASSSAVKSALRPCTASATILAPLGEPVTLANVEKLNQQQSKQQKTKLNR
jgi:hypothetical protein